MEHLSAVMIKQVKCKIALSSDLAHMKRGTQLLYGCRHRHSYVPTCGCVIVFFPPASIERVLFFTRPAEASSC